MNKQSILSPKTWITFIFMLIYATALYFALFLVASISLLQFLFVLFTSKTNTELTDLNKHVMTFYTDTVSFLLYQTEVRPFPFKNASVSSESDLKLEENTNQKESLENVESKKLNEHIKEQDLFSEEKAPYEDDYVSYDNDFMERKDEKSDASKD